MSQQEEHEPERSGAATRTAAGRIVRFHTPHEAYWIISRFLVTDAAYRGRSFGYIVPRLQRLISLGTYACLVDGDQLKAVLVWADIDTEKFKSSRARGEPYTFGEGDKNDGAVIVAVLGVDRQSLNTIIGFGRRVLRGRRIFWNRHREREPRWRS
jgi:hypothetical protein